MNAIECNVVLILIFRNSEALPSFIYRYCCIPLFVVVVKK